MNKKYVFLVIFILSSIFVVIYFNLFKREGKIFNTNTKYETIMKCSGNLTMISYYKVPIGTTYEQCNKNTPLGNTSRVCSNCGNNICEEWENLCTCPSDCH
jgi:hypothetical protein